MSLFSHLFQSTKSIAPVSPEMNPVFIIGLGNPGKKYARTRHNLGWLTLDMLHTEWKASEWRQEKKFQAEVSETLSQGRKVFFIKPQTFMNNSGESVRTILGFHKALPKDIIVLHDEVDIPFGKIKATISSRAAGHNGVKDIIDKLGTQDFCRLRLGVGKSANPHISTADHVLQNFSPEEEKELPPLFEQIESLLKDILSRPR